MKSLLISLFLLTGCSPQPVTTPIQEKPPIQVLQDMESCQTDSDTPWCISACKQATYSWCNK